MSFETGMPLRMNDARPNRDEFQHVGVPLHPFDREFNAHDSVRAHGLGLSPHPLHGELPRVVHRPR